MDEHRQATRAGSALLASGWGRVLIGAVALLAAMTVAALVVLWPAGEPERPDAPAASAPTLPAEVTALRAVECPGPTRQTCRRVVVRLEAGADHGTLQPLSLGPVNLAPTMAVGDELRVQRIEGALPDAEQYGFVSVDRRETLLWLVALFAVLVVVIGRWRGLLALAGFGLSLVLVMRFVVPAISSGEPAFLVALVGSLAVMFVTVVLTYGLRPASLAAILSIALSLALAAALGTAAIEGARLDGRTSEFALALSQTNAALSLQGVVLAGLAFGALGVLADMAVTQASAVMALRHANPRMPVGAVYRAALGVGRDHLIATTHTLVLVYVGATLPLLLVVDATGMDTTAALNLPDLAEPIIATLVGAIALLVSVPLTTALTAVIAAPLPAQALADAGHAH